MVIILVKCIILFLHDILNSFSYHFFLFSWHLLFLICQHLVQCMCGNNMSVPLLANAVTLSGTEKETAVVGDHQLSVFLIVFLVMFCFRHSFFVAHRWRKYFGSKDWIKWQNTFVTHIYSMSLAQKNIGMFKYTSTPEKPGHSKSVFLIYILYCVSLRNK